MRSKFCFRFVFCGLVSLWAGLLPAWGISTNNWIGTGDSFWSAPADWSAGLPSITNALVSIANANTKLIQMGVGTTASTLTISNLLLSAPAGSTNTLVVNINNPPFRILNGLTINNGGSMTIVNATNLVEGISGGRLDVDGGLRVSTFGNLIATNAGLVTSIGRSASGSLTVSTSGTATFSQLVLGNAVAANGKLIVTNVSATIDVANNLTVGLAGSSNQILLAAGNSMSNADGIIANNTGSRSNTVTLSGAGTRWDNSGNLSVGLSGTSNSLVIGPGTTVSDLTGVIGNNLGANFNFVLVRGVWSNSTDLLIGAFGAFNSLVITTGGDVISLFYGILGDSPPSSNNTALVTGAGSTWTCIADMRVGNFGSSNSLTIRNAGRVTAENVFVGTESLNNTLNVENGRLTATNFEAGILGVLG